MRWKQRRRKLQMPNANTPAPIVEGDGLLCCVPAPPEPRGKGVPPLPDKISEVTDYLQKMSLSLKKKTKKPLDNIRLIL